MGNRRETGGLQSQEAVCLAGAWSQLSLLAAKALKTWKGLMSVMGHFEPSSAPSPQPAIPSLVCGFYMKTEGYTCKGPASPSILGL